MKMVIIFAELLRVQHSESITTSVTEGTKGAPVAEYIHWRKNDRDRHTHHWH